MASLRDAVQMCLYNEQQAYGYPKEPFTFHVIKQGNFWELQFIYVVDVFEVMSGVEHSGRYEMIPEWKTEDYIVEIPLECSVEDLVHIVQGALEVISKNEYKQ